MTRSSKLFYVIQKMGSFKNMFMCTCVLVPVEATEGTRYPAASLVLQNQLEFVIAISATLGYCPYF